MELWTVRLSRKAEDHIYRPYLMTPHCVPSDSRAIEMVLITKSMVILNILTPGHDMR